MTAIIPPLPADLNDGLKRLKMAAMRQLAPELLITAKTQRWNPEEFLRTLIEAEIASRDASNIRTRMRQASFPVTKTLDEFDRRLLHPAGHLRLPRILEWIRAAENVCLIGPAGEDRQVPHPDRAGHRRRRRATGSATSPPPNSSKPSTADSPTTPSGNSSTASATTWSWSMNSASRRWTTPEPNLFRFVAASYERRSPASLPTGPSNPGDDSSLNTPPPSACSTGSSTTATPSSPTATGYRIGDKPEPQEEPDPKTS